MKRNKNISIVVGAKMQEGIVLPEYKKISINPNYGKRYFVGYEKRMQLNYCESYLLDWLVEESDDKGIVRTDAATRLKFINFVLRLSQQLEEEILYKDETIKSAFKSLKKLGFIITPEDSRGWAWLNPKYYYKGAEVERYQLIKDIENSLAGNTDSILYDKSKLNKKLKEVL